MERGIALMITIDTLNAFGADTRSGLSCCMNSEAFYLRLVHMELGNNESVVLNIPHGCWLAVRETPDANYWPSYTWRENETFSEWVFASESNPVQITEAASLAYTNTVYVSPTGVSLRVAPYAVMLVMGLALMTALRYGKKRRMD